MSNSSGRFVWYELATTDVAAAKAFYAGVMGWGTGETSAPGSAYTLFTAGNIPVAGLTKLPDEAIRTGTSAQWTGYVGVEDVDATAARVKQLGGTVHVPPTDFPNVSRFSVIGDLELATLVLVKGRQRGQKEPERPGAPGHVIWHELLASNLERVFAFYSELFGWKKTDAYARSEGTYQHFSDGTETIGGISAKPEAWPRALWLYYFSVAGIEEAAERVGTYGGKILYGPIALQNGARVIQCADPQNVPFALIDTRVSVAIGCYAPRNPGGKQAG